MKYCVFYSVEYIFKDIIRCFVISLERNLPPCSKAPEIASQHTDEIKRQLLNATEPVVSTLVGNRKFMEYLTSADIGKCCFHPKYKLLYRGGFSMYLQTAYM